MNFVTVIALIAIKLISIADSAKQANSSELIPINNKAGESSFASGFIRYAADGVFTGFCPICHTVIQDDERIFAFHYLVKGNISKHLYHGKCLYSAWKKKPDTVGDCPSCKRLNPNISQEVVQKNHASICILADTLSVDVVDDKFSKWIPNYEAKNVNEVIREFIAAADSQQKRNLIFPFIKTMFKKKVMKKDKEKNIAQILKNLDSIPDVQKQALIYWKKEVLKSLEAIPESRNSPNESFDTPIPETSKYIVSKLNKQVVLNPEQDDVLASIFSREAQSISRRNSYIYMQKLNVNSFDADENLSVDALLTKSDEFLHSEEAATALIRRYPWERIKNLFTSQAFSKLANNTSNYDNLIWFCLNQRSNFEMHQTFCPFVGKFSESEILSNFNINPAKEDVRYIKELLKNIQDDAILVQVISKWYSQNEFSLIITHYSQIISRVKCCFSNAALAYYFMTSFLEPPTLVMRNEMVSIVKKCNFPSALLLMKRINALGVQNFTIVPNETDPTSTYFLPLIHHYEPKLNLIQILEQFENVAQQWMPFFQEIFYVSAVLSKEEERKAFEEYLISNASGKKPSLTEKQIDFIRNFDVDFGKLNHSISLMLFLKGIIQRVNLCVTSSKK